MVISGFGFVTRIIVVPMVGMVASLDNYGYFITVVSENLPGNLTTQGALIIYKRLSIKRSGHAAFSRILDGEKGPSGQRDYN